MTIQEMTNALDGLVATCENGMVQISEMDTTKNNNARFLLIVNQLEINLGKLKATLKAGG